ncbi:MAG: hypothetical protein WEB88_00765 [Gemmatimonadota bacterium]
MLNAALAVLLVLQTAPLDADSAAGVRARARSAEATYERLARRLVATTLHRPVGGPCDEIVGRFCLTYGRTGYVEPAPEAGPVIDARREAIEALRLALGYDPSHTGTAAPLVRYLVEDGRAAEAGSVARLYASLGRDSVQADLLLGFAHHAAGADAAAEPLLRRGLAALPAHERERIEALGWLLPYAERERYRRLSAEDRIRYARRFWAWADPLWLTSANERWAEHVARHVWARLLAAAPVVAGMNRWGEDLDELTVRYGIPSGRTRTWGAMPGEGSLVEHFDDAQLAFDPPALLGQGLPHAPPPGTPWALAEERATTGYAPVGLETLEPLEHQLSRFPADSVWEVRVDGAVALVGGGVRVRTGLFVRDTLLMRDAARAHGAIPAAGHDSVRWTLRAAVPPGAWVYGAEAVAEGVPRRPATPGGREARPGSTAGPGNADGLAAWRARYRVDLPALTAAPLLSDVVVARPFGAGPFPTGREDAALRPRSSLVVPARTTVGLYAEVHGLEGERYRVSLVVESGREPSLLGRAAGWLGRTLGLRGPDDEPRLEWEARAPVEGLAVLAVDLDLGLVEPGLRRIRLEVEDARGRRAVSERVVLVTEG